MEQVWIRSKASFINQVIGHVSNKQRLLCSARVAYELQAMGLVEIEEQEKKPDGDIGTAGEVTPSSASHQDQASESEMSPDSEESAEPSQLTITGN
jgi:hypothetical protein